MEGGVPSEGGVDAPADAGTSCVPGIVLHAPPDGGVLGKSRLIATVGDGGPSVREADPVIAPTDQNVAVLAYLATAQNGATFIGTVQLDASGSATPPSPPRFGFGGAGATRQNMPSLAY